MFFFCVDGLTGFPEAIEAVESLHRSMREATKTRGSFPHEDAALKLLYLGIANVTRRWKFVGGWRAALNHFQIRWPDRMARLEAH